MTWDLSCPDWKDRLRTGRSLVPDLPLYRGEGERAVNVLNKLRLADVPGTPMLADATGDWFRDPTRALFGSLDPVTQVRHIRELFLLVPKKNSKTTNGALLMLTALLLNRRPHASMIMTAPVQDVAQLAFDAAAGAIELDDVLKKKLHVREHLKKIVHRETKAELEIMSFDPAALTGQKPVAVLIDELHVVAKMSKAASAIRQLRGGMLPFPEAFMAFITTQSEEAPVGVFKAELTKARRIRDGQQRGAMLPVLYEFPPEIQKDPAQWQNPANWHMVTPNNGKSITIARLEEEFETARETGQEELRAWASQHLDIEIGLALRSDNWAGAEEWEKQAAPKRCTLPELLRRCEVICVGVDGGGLDDLLGLSAAGRCRETGDWLVWCKAWAHPIVLERRKSEASKLLDLETTGDLVIVETIGEDVEQLAAHVLEIYDAGLLNKIGVDPSGIGAVLDALKKAGLPEKNAQGEDMIVGITQGYKLNGTIKTTERKLAEGTLWHGGTELMNWCVGNAKIEQRGNAILITKQASGTAKIDPLMALFNAVDLLSRNPDAMGGLDDWLSNPIVAGHA